MAEKPVKALGLLGLLWLKPLRRAFRGLDLSESVRLGTFAFVGLFFLATIYSIFKPVTTFLWSRPELGPLLSARVLSVAFSLLFLMMLFSALLAFLGRLIFADDAAHFAASPLDPKVYFEMRLWQAFVSSAWMIFILWFPYLWALRRAVGQGALFALWGALAPWPMAALASALAAGILCLLVRRLPPERLRGGLFAAAVLVGLTALLGLRFSRPERLADPERAKTVAAYLASMDRLEPAWWPPTWASRAVMRALDAPGEALLWWLLSLVAALGAWRGIVALFGNGAFELWWKGQESGEGPSAVGGRHAFSALQRRAPWRVLLERDAVALWRAPGQRLQALLLLSLIALFVFSLGRLPLEEDQGLKDMLFLPVSMVGQVILLAVTARFVFPAGSLEQQGSWLLYHAPVGAWDHIKAKGLLFAAGLLPLSLLLGGVMDRQFSPPPVGVAVALADFIVLPFTLAFMNTGLGIAWAKRGVSHAEEVISSPSGVLAMVLGTGVVLLQNALMAVPIKEAWWAARVTGYHVKWPLLFLVLLLWLGLHATAVLWPLRLAMRRIEGERE